jgi:hypothetical protein
MQFKKHDEPMVSTLSGISIEVNPEDEKQKSPIDFKLDFGLKWTCLNETQLRNTEIAKNEKFRGKRDLPQTRMIETTIADHSQQTSIFECN